MEGDYKITVRAHAGNPQYTDAKIIYRVSRQKIGFGTEYLGSNNVCYHQSILKPQNIGYDDLGARLAPVSYTHLTLPTNSRV